MSFQLNRKSNRQFKKLARTFLTDSSAIERQDEDSFVIWGIDALVGTPSSVGVDVNKKGRITNIQSFAMGADIIGEWDNQFYAFDVKKPGKTIKWLSRQGVSSEPVYFDMTNPQPIADTFNEILPGLSGGPLDVYVAFGEYTAFA